MSRTRLQSCNRGNRRGIATETVEPLHSKLVFYTFAIKSVSTVKLMHPYCVKIELWKRAKGCFRGEWGAVTEERAQRRLTRNADLNLTNGTRS